MCENRIENDYNLLLRSQTHFLCVYDKLPAKHTFMKVLVITFEPQFYNMPLVEHIQTINHIESKLLKLGTTSLTHRLSWLNKEDMVLATYDAIEVLTDSQTRRPTPFPDWFVNTYRTRGENIQLDLAEPRSVPESAETLAIKVSGNHIDANNHVNAFVYPRFGEMAVYNLLNKKYNMKEPARVRTREMLLLYKHEIVLGDNLRLRYWQDEADRCVIHIVFDNVSQSNVSMYARFTLFDISVHSNL